MTSARAFVRARAESQAIHSGASSRGFGHSTESISLVEGFLCCA